ncbi:MAG: trypsin-like peptidase domain-containing protein [Acidobacteria bacterium]|nr:trypsin-like peptidase domain-containing protein [Acidobacteriota bacterium]
MPRAVPAIALLFVASTAALLGVVGGGGGTVAVPGRIPGPATSFADIVEQINPSVVHVMVVDRPGSAVDDEEELSGGEEDGTGEDPHGFGPRRGEGSGFVVDAAGYILTNHHLVASPARIRVRLTDKRELPAQLVGSDPSTDIALIKVAAAGLAPVPLGDSDRLRVGDWVCAIGNPLSFDHSVTVGVVSSKGRKIWDASFDSYIQTDAAINPGNSGGPLLNADGEAVGINAAVSTEGQGIGFAIPINVAREILGQLRTRGRVARGYLGIQLQELDPDLERLLGLPESRGALVVDVLAGAAGEAAGLRRYDVITSVSGQAIRDGDQLVRAISAHAPGTGVRLSVVRDGRDVAVDAVLGERGAPGAPRVVPAVVEAVPDGGDPLGLKVIELSRKTRKDLRVPDDRVGVVIKDVLSLSPDVDRLTHGDIVVEVNRRATPDLETYQRVVSELRPGERAWLFVYRPRPSGSFLTKVEVETAR